MDYIRRRLLARSAVDEVSPVVNGVHCRVWTGRSLRGGYARLWDGERLVDAHRLAHEVWKGPIPAGLEVMHECDRPGCIEAGHLRAGTSKENSEDMVRKGRHLAGARLRGERLRGRVGLRGERHGKVKLTEVEVREIKRRLVSGRDRRDCPAWLAREFGVSSSLIYGIRDGRNWGWL
jgi:hypothetical protein